MTETKRHSPEYEAAAAGGLRDAYADFAARERPDSFFYQTIGLADGTFIGEVWADSVRRFATAPMATKSEAHAALMTQLDVVNGKTTRPPLPPKGRPEATQR